MVYGAIVPTTLRAVFVVSAARSFTEGGSKTLELHSPNPTPRGTRRQTPDQQHNVAVDFL